MSEEVTVTCPKCGKTGSFTLWTSLNIAADLYPEKKAQVLDGSLFQYPCPQCGKKTWAEYRMLYNHNEDKVMVYAEPDYSPAHQPMIQELMDTLTADGYVVRVVPNINSLREKVLIFDDGLDDRIIEINKLYMLVAMIQDGDEHLKAPGGCKMYYAGGKGVKNLLITADGVPDLTVDISGLYKELAIPKVLEHLPPLEKSGPVIDRAWAAEYCNATKALKEHGCL
ncbi:MAG: CpXC domain-containing protein [Abditibacteriota bacterium]|nr:CpXC domain-containing protein [Abditibacteriota bacterium]